MSVYRENAIAQFENVNSLRSYPFEDGSLLVDRTGKALPQDVIVDVHMVVPAIGELPSAPSVRLTSVHLSPSMVSACFKSDSGGRTCALSVTVAVDNFRPYMPYALERLYGAEDVGGVVTFGDIDFPGYPETYFMDTAKVHPCCVALARPARLRSVIDRRSGDALYGDVRISFSGHVRSEGDGKSFSLSLESGSEIELASECMTRSSAGICGATPVTSINGVEPDEDGNIVLWFH